MWPSIRGKVTMKILRHQVAVFLSDGSVKKNQFDTYAESRDWVNVWSRESDCVGGVTYDSKMKGVTYTYISDKATSKIKKFIEAYDFTK